MLFDVTATWNHNKRKRVWNKNFFLIFYFILKKFFLLYFLFNFPLNKWTAKKKSYIYFFHLSSFLFILRFFFSLSFSIKYTLRIYVRVMLTSAPKVFVEMRWRMELNHFNNISQRIQTFIFAETLASNSSAARPVHSFLLSVMDLWRSHVRLDDSSLSAIFNDSGRVECSPLINSSFHSLDYKIK